MAKFWKALVAEPSEKVRDFIKLALFTGQRRMSVLTMKWADVNLDRAVWVMPHTKTGRHTVPLSVTAIEILRRREQSRGDSEYVLPSRHSGFLKDVPRTAWGDILERAGIRDFRIHDLRRSMGSFQTDEGASRAIVGACLATCAKKRRRFTAAWDWSPSAIRWKRRRRQS